MTAGNFRRARPRAPVVRGGRRRAHGRTGENVTWGFRGFAGVGVGHEHGPENMLFRRPATIAEPQSEARVAGGECWSQLTGDEGLLVASDRVRGACGRCGPSSRCERARLPPSKSAGGQRVCSAWLLSVAAQRSSRSTDQCV